MAYPANITIGEKQLKRLIDKNIELKAKISNLKQINKELMESSHEAHKSWQEELRKNEVLRTEVDTLNKYIELNY